MALRKAARVLLAIAILFGLYALVRQLPLLRWIVEGARIVHGFGWAGVLATVLAVYLLTLLLVPVIPLIVAAGWLYGPAAAVLSLIAAVASAATSFALARAFGRAAARQALYERPRARALADLAAEGGILTVTLIRLSPLLPGVEAIERGETIHGTAVWILLAVALVAAAVLGTAAARRLQRMQAGKSPQEPGADAAQADGA